MAAQNIPRRQAIPVLYTRGTHYDVGFDMGRTFSSMIKNFLSLSKDLNIYFLPLYNSNEGKKVYNETLESVKISFPQYVRELEGIADGAQVEFYKLFLLHMDSILVRNVDNEADPDLFRPSGCSTIIINNKDCRLIAHTEDAVTETLNNYYFVVAHIINDTPQGKYNVKEERFMSLCYAGHLPGYTMNYNHHGLVFSINTISADILRSGKTPRHFLTRALLSTRNFDEAIKVLKDTGVGVADACSVNLGFVNDDTKNIYNIEIGPVPENEKETILNIKTVPYDTSESYNFHANKYERLKIKEVNPHMAESSITRMKLFNNFKAPDCIDDARRMLGDCSTSPHCVFRENNQMDQDVKTIAVGFFDLNERTFALFSDNPKLNEPHVTLPLILHPSIDKKA